MDHSPLPERLRPQSFQEIVGQPHLLDEQGILHRSIAAKTPLSIILWGPPGSGKTSIARLYAQAFDMHFVAMSGVWSQISDLKKLIQEQERSPLLYRGTLLFVDEIHRFNKAQQDAFLPLVENGTIVLIGATAENPSFYLNHALLSRVRVLPVHPLKEDSLELLVQRYETNHPPLPLSPEGRAFLLSSARGDGRYLYHLIENIALYHRPGELLGPDQLTPILQRKYALYDKQGDHHYNLISALHKSVRGSDPDAALYWLARMLEGGADRLYVCRRMIRMAIEDVGLADPQALTVALNTKNTYEALGSPEGELALYEAIIYLALSPKSNASYAAAKQVVSCAQQHPPYAPPPHIINAPTAMMREMGFGKSYLYDHDCNEAFSGQNYFPDELPRETFYNPVARGFERELQKRVAFFERLRSQRQTDA